MPRGKKKDAPKGVKVIKAARLKVGHVIMTGPDRRVPMEVKSIASGRQGYDLDRLAVGCGGRGGIASQTYHYNVRSDVYIEA